MTAKVSSIHVNGWFGDYDKLAMTRIAAARKCSRSISMRERDALRVRRRLAQRCADVRVLPATRVGVANVRAFLDRIATPPAYVTRGEAGAGFVGARRLSAARESA